MACPRCDWKARFRLMDIANRNRLVATFLERRGYTSDVLSDLNDGSHADLLDVDVLVDELYVLHDDGGRVVILPDFDMDGISSGVLGFAGLSELGFNAALFRPDPSEGYGFTEQTIDRLLAEFPDAAAIITCDTGITCYGGIDEAKACGVRMFVTDHHVQQDARRMHADVVVDPSRIDDTYANKGICGAHVLWQVLMHYAVKYGTAHEQEQIRRLRVFAGIGTISDAMPLVHENRPLVRDACGICRLLIEPTFLDTLDGSSAYLRAFRGLSTVLSLFADMGKIATADDIDSDFFGYYLAPMFNSAKRMDGDMDTVFGVFFGNDPDGDARALYRLNEQRKAAVDTALHAMYTADQPYAPYVYLSDARAGVLGLLATRVLKDTGMPAFVVARDGNGFHGSGRTPEWYPAIDKLVPEGFYIAGHQNAFGIGVTDVREMKSLVAYLDKSVAETLDGLVIEKPKPDIYLSTFDADADFGIDIPLFSDYVREIKDYAPFGHGFEKPRIALTFHGSEAVWSTIGSMKQHLKAVLPYGLELLCWNQAGMLGVLENADVVRVWGSLGVSEFRGRRTVNFIGDAEVVA